MGRARYGVVTAGAFRKQRAGMPCPIVGDREGLPAGGPGARSPRAARRDAGYATSIIPDYAVLHPGLATSLFRHRQTKVAETDKPGLK